MRSATATGCTLVCACRLYPVGTPASPLLPTEVYTRQEELGHEQRRRVEQALILDTDAGIVAGIVKTDRIISRSAGEILFSTDDMTSSFPWGQGLLASNSSARRFAIPKVGTLRLGHANSNRRFVRRDRSEGQECRVTVATE